MTKVEYVAKGIVHAGLVNPWKVDKQGIFKNLTEELNKMSEEGWELVDVLTAGNADRGIYFFRREK